MAIATVFDPANKVPGIYIDVQLGVGPRTGGTGLKTLVLIGNKLSAGTMLVEQEYPVSGTDEAITLAGAGSELHNMVRAAIAAYPSVRLYMVAVTESAGSKAARTVVFTGTASAAGTCYVMCLGETIQVPYLTSDTPTAIAARVATYIGYQGHWPITAGAATGTLTLTAKQNGPRGNKILVQVWVDAGTTVSVPALSTTTGDFLTGGSTSDSPQNALDSIAMVRRSLLAVPYDDSTNLTLVRTHLDAQDAPEAGNRKQAIAASIDTIGNTQTLALSQNFPREQLVWLRNASVPPSMLAAAVAAKRAQREAVSAAYNYDAEVIEGIPQQAFPAWKASGSDQKSALDQGVTPLASDVSGRVMFVRSVTCKSQDSAGRPDWRVLDTSKVTVSDEAADRFELKLSEYAGWMASDDPPEGEAPRPNTMTPTLFRDILVGELLGMEDDSLIPVGSTVAAVEAGVLQAELSKVSPGRFNSVVPIDVIEGFHQASVAVRQVG